MWKNFKNVSLEFLLHTKPEIVCSDVVECTYILIGYFFNWFQNLRNIHKILIRQEKKTMILYDILFKNVHTIFSFQYYIYEKLQPQKILITKKNSWNF